MTMIGVAAAAPVCAPAFVLAFEFVPVAAFIPVCVAPVEFSLEPPFPVGASVIPMA